MPVWCCSLQFGKGLMTGSRAEVPQGEQDTHFPVLPSVPSLASSLPGVCPLHCSETLELLRVALPFWQRVAFILGASAPNPSHLGR